LTLLLPAILAFTVDRLTKALVVARFAEGESACVGRWLTIRHLAARRRKNEMARTHAFSLLVWLSSLCILLFILYQGYFFQRSLAQAGLGAALGGSAGNLYDRLGRGTVIDFFDVGWWPVFNVADIAITLGAIAALATMR